MERVRKRLLLVSLLAQVATASFAQTPNPDASPDKPAALAPEAPYVLHVSTREVLVDVIAVDSRNEPIADLTAADLRVVEDIGHSHAHDADVSVSSFRLIDPTAGPTSANSGSLPPGGFRIAANESCLQRQTIHYELAYHPGPEGLTGGSHQVEIRSKRRGVRLFYRHSYFIGATAPSANAQKSEREIDKELQVDACSHPVSPLSVSLRAARISTGSEDLVRYSVSIDSGSLDFVTFPENRRQLKLDYGACNFSAAGKPINYMRASTDQVLTPVEFARAQAHGFDRLFEFAPPQDIAMTRFVVRDRTTGNLGLVDVNFSLSEGPLRADFTVMEDLRREIEMYAKAKAQQEDAAARAGAAGWSAPPPFQMYTVPPQGPLGSFGSVVPRPHAFCGDVYELHANISRLPDFRELDPIGSIYTDSLAVPNQVFEGTNGIPGVTDRTIWFGVDYHANFWIRTAGTYDFRMTSDDGAILQIDDKRVIDLDNLHSAFTKDGHIALDAGRHTIHVPYYEGTPYAVALSLWVRGPGEDWKIFDLRDFADPKEHAGPVARADEK
jgi:PA14 domain